MFNEEMELTESIYYVSFKELGIKKDFNSELMDEHVTKDNDLSIKHFINGLQKTIDKYSK